MAKDKSILTLETKLGPKGGDLGVSRVMACLAPTAANNATYRADLKLWLIKNGISDHSARTATDTSMAKAYCSYPYLKGWRKRVNPNWDLLGSGDDEEEVNEAVAAAAAAATSDVPTAQSGGGLSEDQIKALFENLEETTGRLVDRKLNSVELKITTDVANRIRQLAHEQAMKTIADLAEPRKIEIVNAEGKVTASLGLQHEKFPTLLRAIQARNNQGFRLNIWMTGPTGSGKTTAAENACKALQTTFSSYSKNENGVWEIRGADGNIADLNGLSHDAPFGADGSLDADYKVIGFKDANGKFHWTTFLRIFVYGGVYVADEIDNWAPSALLALNSALANGWVSTPIGMLKRHSDAVIIACANTWGLGATNDYVGRTKLDQASLDRFQPKINWPYDEKLERAVAQSMGQELGIYWHNLVLSARHAAQRQGLKIVISPRSTYNGIALLQQGFTAEEVMEQTFLAGVAPEQIRSLAINVGTFSQSDVA